MLRKIGVGLLVVHGAIAMFSLVGTWGLYHLENIPDWDYARLTFWLGILNVLSGVGCAILLMAYREGWRTTLLLFALCMVLAGGMELLGTTTGVPFGAYSYTDLMGPKFLGHVPYLIPPSWMMMLYPSMMIAQRLVSGVWGRVVLAGVVLTIWDFAMDPAMTTGFAYWQWHTEGGFYGMPWVNWFGWWLTGSLVAAVFWKTSREWRGAWEPAALALYLVQGAFMAGLAWLYMRPLATWLWLGATALVMVALASQWRAENRIERAMEWNVSR